MVWQYRNGRNKYGNVQQSYNGHPYASKKEAAYAQELDLRVKAGELKSWERQKSIEMKVKGKKICTYVIDFVEVYPDKSEMYTEVKGLETGLWRIKWKLFEALYPKLKKQIIR